MKAFYERVAEEYHPSEKGTLVFLNGTSSCGKTTIAQALQKTLAEKHEQAFLHYALDDFAHILTSRTADTPVLEAFDTPEVWQRILYAFHLTLPKLIEAGNNVIVDHVFHGVYWSRHITENLCDTNVLFVGVRCPLDVVKERERARNDREDGLAEFHFSEAHRFCHYDLELDSSTESIEESVEKIISMLLEHDPQDFQGIRNTYAEIEKHFETQ